MRMLIPVLLLFGWSTGYAADVVVLTYHDIVENPRQDQYAVSTKNFRSQLEYLKKYNYRPISLARFASHSQGRAPLPDKAVMLTFDDGLKSYQDIVVPLLKEYGYPSVLSIVSIWADGLDQPPEYKNRLLSWKQIKQLQQSPLVEVVSHSHNLHRWVSSSPQETYAPSAITRIYHSNTKKYETEEAFRKRIRDDLVTSRERFIRMTGQAPAALTWPYGEYDRTTMEIARQAGFRYQLTLDEGSAISHELPRIRRYMLLRDHKLKDLQAMLQRSFELNREQRFVEFDLDLFVHVSTENHVLLMKQLVNRIGSLGVNTVIVTPFTADRDKAFFPNSEVPVARDLLNGILDRIQAQLGIEQVYLRFPEGKEKLPEHVFADLARNSRFNAVLFDQDPGAVKLDLIRAALKKYLPAAKIGSWRNGGKGPDLAVIADGKLTEKQSGKKVLVHIDREKFLTTSGLSEALRRLRAKGVRNYGFGSLNYLAGSRAPEALVEAMAYRLPESKN